MSMCRVTHTDSETNTCMCMTAACAVANKLFICLLFYTLPNPESEDQSASQVPATIRLTLKQL